MNTQFAPRRMAGTLLAAGALLSTAVLATTAAAQAPGRDWPTFNGPLTGTRYSPLAEITTKNVKHLRLAAHFDPGGTSNFQTGPVVIGGTMFLTTFADTYAINAATGQIKWKHLGTHQKSFLAGNRGVAYADGKVFRGTSDGSVLALNAATGETLWTTPIANTAGGESIPMAPIAWHGMVFVGNAGGDNFGVTGRIYALDAATGKQVWRFDTVPQTGPAAATWIKRSAANPPTGGTSWTTYSLDPASGVLFTATGNVAPDFAEALHPGENLYATCVLALDASTGHLIAFTQATKHDYHDWDVAAAPALITTRAGRHLAATGGKDGLLHGIEVSHAVRPVTDAAQAGGSAAQASTSTSQAAYQPGQAPPAAIPAASGDASLYGTAGKDALKTLYLTPVTRRFNTQVPLNTQTFTRFGPGTQGGVEWNGPAFAPAQNLLVVPATDWPTSIKLVPDDKRPAGQAGKPWTGASGIAFGQQDPPSRWGGYLTALDADSGQVRWKYRAATPMVGAVTTTGGGLVFAGDLNGDLRAFDVNTGRVLWTEHTGRPIGGGLVSYAVGGHQYVAVVEGINEVLWPTKKTPPRLAIYRLP